VEDLQEMKTAVNMEKYNRKTVTVIAREPVADLLGAGEN